MQHEIVVSGFGGQGVLFAGQLLAYAAMDTGLHVTWLPSYGPEMRGGTAHCVVIIGDDPIGSPLVRSPEIALAMNNPSLEKYEPLVKPGGLLVVNSSLMNEPPARADIDIILVPANEEAERLGNKRLANIVMLGAMLGVHPVVTPDALTQALRDHLPKRHLHLLDANIAAIQRGAEFGIAQHA